MPEVQKNYKAIQRKKAVSSHKLLTYTLLWHLENHQLLSKTYIYYTPGYL